MTQAPARRPGWPDVMAVEPLTSPPDATAELPGSKSITNRALLAAALADGTSTLRGALFADDTEAMIGALRSLGYTVSTNRGAATVSIAGRGGAVPSGPAVLDARQSGTTARFVAPALALGAGPYTLDGSEQLRSRPMGPLVDALRDLGASVTEDGATGRLPLTFRDGGLTGDRVTVPGDISSQFLSGLMLVGPLLAKGLCIEMSTPPVSVPYLDLTANVMAVFGAEVDCDGDHRRIRVAPGPYRPARFKVEPDASAAAYFLAAAAITGGRVRIEGLGDPAEQGDWHFANVLGAMGARVEWANGTVTVTGTGHLHGVDVDLRDLSDTAPTLAVVAAFADSPTRVRGIGFIRAKETDRIAAVVTELQRLGVDAVAEDDGLLIRPGRLVGARVETYDDHRMAMSFAVAGLVVPGVEIVDPGCVTKTFPDFWSTLDRLRQ